MLTRHGRFLVYIPQLLRQTDRYNTVKHAVEKLAERLGVTVEDRRRNVPSVWVFYKNESQEEEIPMYCDKGKNWDKDDVYFAIRSLVYALSFHPNHTELEGIRKNESIDSFGQLV